MIAADVESVDEDRSVEPGGRLPEVEEGALGGLILHLEVSAEQFRSNWLILWLSRQWLPSLQPRVRIKENVSSYCFVP